MKKSAAPPQRRQRGALISEVLEYLQANGGQLSSSEITSQFGTSNATTQLKRAVDDGRLVAQKVGQTYVYSLASRQEPADPEKLQIGIWSDGDVSVKGLAISEDGTVIMTRNQVLEPMGHLTHAYLSPPAAPVQILDRLPTP